MGTVLAVPVVVLVHPGRRNDEDVIDVGNFPHLRLDGKHSLPVVLCTVELFSAVVGMFTDMLIGGVALVEQDDNTALSFELYPVTVTTLHTVRDTVRADTTIATDEWSAVALLGEELENAQHRSPSSDDVVHVPTTHTLPPLNLTFLCGSPCGALVVVCVAVV